MTGKMDKAALLNSLNITLGVVNAADETLSLADFRLRSVRDFAPDGISMRDAVSRLDMAQSVVCDACEELIVLIEQVKKMEEQA